MTDSGGDAVGGQRLQASAREQSISAASAQARGTRMAAPKGYYPSLEATTDSDKQVVDQGSGGLIPQHLSYPTHQDYRHELASHPSRTSRDGLTSTKNGKSFRDRRNRPRSVLLASAALIAVVSGLLGGIVGWQVTTSKTSSAAPAPAPSSNSTIPPSGAGLNITAGASKTIRANSSLAVAGWRTGPDFQIRLFYQGPDDRLRFNIFDTAIGAWGKPNVLDNIKAAASNTPLAATILWWSSNHGLYYIGSPNKLLGQNWFDAIPASGAADSVNNQALTAGSGSRLAALWPSVILQNDSASVQETAFGFNGYTTPASLDIDGSSGTSLLALPFTTTHEGQDIRIMFRHSDGQLYSFDRNSNGTVQPTSRSTRFPLPPNAPLAGFAMAVNDATPSVKTVVLWQDGTNITKGGISYIVSTNNGVSWDGLYTDDIFADADVPTQIACLTPGLTGSGTGSTAKVVLQSSTSINRCYFQVGGAVKEVLYDGNKWQEVDFVYMP
ncbi:hypothetical protein GQ53DRAFT_856145 [Thozetella sp. PMI_491]|nr:hypothetical protein GQ53DRAFT_856145 [Thozetella sp. PMI_491]